MSFSVNTKNELARVTGSRTCCKRAELAALVRMDGSIQISRNQLALSIVTENAAVARKVLTLVKDLFGLNTEVLVRRKIRLRKNNVYLVRIPPQPGIREILLALGLLDSRGQLAEGVKDELLRQDCCRRAYLRGVFLGGGSVNNPEGNYHLEIITNNREQARSIEGLMQKFNLAARTSSRKNWHVVYLKESEHIVDCLNIMGAHHALLSFENTRIYKDMRNQVNRLVNCETANLNKTVNAAVRQLENIQFIAARLGLEKLPASLGETARVRLEHPDASLRELGEMLSPRVGKSGVNHRLRKLDRIAQRLREKVGNS